MPGSVARHGTEPPRRRQERDEPQPEHHPRLAAQELHAAPATESRRRRRRPGRRRAGTTPSRAATFQTRIGSHPAERRPRTSAKRPRGETPRADGRTGSPPPRPVKSSSSTSPGYRGRSPRSLRSTIPAAPLWSALRTQTSAHDQHARNGGSIVMITAPMRTTGRSAAQRHDSQPKSRRAKDARGEDVPRRERGRVTERPRAGAPPRRDCP